MKHIYRYHVLAKFFGGVFDGARKRIQGVTLIEVLVTLGIATTVLSTISALVIRSLHSAQFGTNQNLATQHAVSGMDTIRKIRDSSWNTFLSYNAVNYCLDQSFNLQPKVGTCGKNVGIFTREISIEHDNAVTCSGASKVTATVTWSDSSCASGTSCHSSHLISCFSAFSVITIPTVIPTVTPTPIPTLTPTPLPTLTPTLAPTPIPTLVPTATPTPLFTPTPTPTPPIITTSLLPLADAFVQSNNGNSNFGTAIAIEIDGSGSPTSIGYFKFDLTPYAGKTILSATLHVRVTNASDDTQTFRTVDNTTWGETAITYNNRPSVGAVITSIIGGSSDTFKDINLTSAASVKTGQIFSFAIDQTGTNGWDFKSKETSVDKPVLIIQSQ